ncbi:hypothetical protein QC763_306160 [Podospora pseudopauciseta]|uniref:Uncharacterized protein n=1 Tax=Podospora pseudopauciseta TaxID=2093780 RepID=A0ABR0HGK4_9PEZI|nr:hypothetical protein QC763_306160 [Podospora pseudopauciseta]
MKYYFPGIPSPHSSFSHHNLSPFLPRLPSLPLPPPRYIFQVYKMPTSNVVNGDSPHSATIRHLLTYPCVQDGVRTVKSTSVGSKAVDLSNGVYQSLAQNVFPYLAGPYSFVAPYVERVDSVGDKTLEVIEEKFPVVKKQPGEIVEGTKQMIFSPYHAGRSVKEYVLSIFETKKQSCGDSWTAYPTAVVATTFYLIGETAINAGDYIIHKKEEEEGKTGAQRPAQRPANAN